MSKMNTYLDGNPVLYPQNNLLEPTFTLRKKDEDGFKAYSFTGDLTFVKSDYDYLYQVLKTDANALTNKVILKFEYICCETTIYYSFRITADSITWCDNECKITAAATEDSSDVEIITCLKNTLIADNWNGFKNQQHPRFSYCNELRPSWLHHVVMIIGALFVVILNIITPVLIIIAAIVNIINTIINAINTIPGINVCGGQNPCIDFDGDPSSGPYQDLMDWKNKIVDRIIGCGRKHPSPLIRDYADNVCGKCGATFQSSIFSDPSSIYFNACYHFAPVDKGVDATDGTTYWIDKNEPYLNGFMFLEKLKGLFNADWYISNNTVVFERKDKNPYTNIWLDLTALGTNDYTCCFNWAKKQRYSYGDFHYSQDSINTVGNEAIKRWGDIVEWNSPYSSRQKGELKPVVEFAACRFRNDGIDEDVISFYQNSAAYIGTGIGSYNTSIILNQHLCFLPMILIWDGQSKADARVSPYTLLPSHPTAAANQTYNCSMWFWEHGNVSIYGDWTNSDNNLYTNFWYIENPRISGYIGIDYEAEVELTCDRLLAMSLDGKVKTSEGTGNTQEVTINFAAKSITIKGTI